MSVVTEVLDIVSETVGNLVRWAVYNYRNEYSEYVTEASRRGQEVFKDAAAVSIKLLIVAFKWMIIIGTLLGSAAVVYAFLYLIIMPKMTFDQQLYFDYGHHPAVSDEYSQGAKQLPTANVDFLTTRTQWYLSPEVDTEVRKTRILYPEMSYDVIVSLKLPLSEVNERVGMFMVNVEMKDPAGKLLARSTRPLTISQQFPIVRAIRTLFWGIPIALGIQEQEEETAVISFNGYSESYDFPVASAHITLSHPEVQLYGGRIAIIAQLSGIRYYMYHWFVLTAALCILHIAFFQAIGLALVYLAYTATPEDANDDDIIVKDAVGHGDGEEEKFMELPGELDSPISDKGVRQRITKLSSTEG